jgi:two-component system response regulator HupR/HoxA
VIVEQQGESSRPTRRHARVRCELQLEGISASGFSTNISTSGLFVRSPLAEAQRAEIRPGLRLTVRVELRAEAPPLSVAAEVVWTNPQDRDINGREVLGIGLRLLDISSEVQARLGAFIRDFRYTVVILADETPPMAAARAALADDYRVVRCHSAEEALATLTSQEVAVLLLDQDQPELNALAFLREVAEVVPHAHLKRVVLSGHTESEELLHELINVGHVFHYLRKPFRQKSLLQVVAGAVDAYALSAENERLNTELERANRRLQRENAYLRRRVRSVEGFDNIIGHSPALLRALDELARIRHSDVTVQIQGETGTGKELVARALHYNGPRASGPFVAQNCAGIAETLLQSTLFGHRRGAFTGAERDHPGVFQQADGGTLFLDEVAELSLAMQAALLRALQEKEVLPVGASRPVKVDVRIISATHKDLRDEIRHGRFREDLYFRLVVIFTHIPALRERKGDIPLLAQHFLDLLAERYDKDIPGFDTEAMAVLERHDWPGNVRELENEVERLVLLAPPATPIAPGLISPHVRQPSLTSIDFFDEGDSAAFAGRSYDDAVRDLERSMVKWALEQCGGVVSRAAEMLKMDRSRLSKLRRRLGLD